MAIVPPALRMRLLHDEIGLASCLLLHVLGDALRRHECRPKKCLELPVRRGLGFQLLDLLSETGPLEQRLFQTVGDLPQEPVDAVARVTSKPGATDFRLLDVVEGQRHLRVRCGRRACLQA